MMEEMIVTVGMADLHAVQKGGLRTAGLGSCVGVALYHAGAGIAGMAHIMLPSSEIAREGNLNPAKYADTAIPELIRRMEWLGGAVRQLRAKLAGGAQMFAFGGSEAMRIGPRNVEACRGMLRQFGIPIIGEDTGGNYGRTIELHCNTGILHIRSVQQGVKEL